MIETTQNDSVETRRAADAAARSQFYRSQAAWTRFPSEAFHREAREGRVADAARMEVDALPFGIESSERYLAALGKVGADYTEFQSAYVSAFDVGAGGAPCPLYAGAWRGDRQSAMEEALRYYRFFGLRVSGEDELPDHLPAELEFLHYLTFKEAQADSEAGAIASLRRGSRDFLCRHVTRWLNPAAERIETLDVPEFWSGVVGLIRAFCAADAQYLVGLEGPPAE